MMRIPSRLDGLAAVRREVEAVARQAGLSEPDVQALVLCVHEAVVNAIQHGNRFDPMKWVGVDFRRGPDFLAVEVTDEGGGFSSGILLDEEKLAAGTPHAQERTEDPRPRSQDLDQGHGLALIYALADEVQLDSKRGRVVIKKHRRPDLQ